MTASFTSKSQETLFRGVVAELRGLKYTKDLLFGDGYSFGDWFNPAVPTRRIAAAAFGQTPISYDTACFGVALANGNSGFQMIEDYRALGAPIVFEIADTHVTQWAIGANKQTTQPQFKFGASELKEYFHARAAEWAPREFLRTKTIGVGPLEYQKSLFAGVIPELESRIREILDPVLTITIRATIAEF